jgi:hypothetical protein
MSHHHPTTSGVIAMSEQAIPIDILQAAHKAAEAYCCDNRTSFAAAMQVSEGPLLDVIAAALLAERQKHDRPISPDLQAEAERVFADVQRAVLVEDAKQVIAKELRAAERKGRDAEAARITKREARKVVAWLHARANSMKDLRAKSILDLAADELGRANADRFKDEA